MSCIRALLIASVLVVLGYQTGLFGIVVSSPPLLPPKDFPTSPTITSTTTMPEATPTSEIEMWQPKPIPQPTCPLIKDYCDDDDYPDNDDDYPDNETDNRKGDDADKRKDNDGSTPFLFGYTHLQWAIFSWYLSKFLLIVVIVVFKYCALLLRQRGAYRVGNRAFRFTRFFV